MKNPYIITEIEKKSATATAWTGVIFVTLTLIGMFWYGISHASTYGTNILTGGTASASSEYNAGCIASYGDDQNTSTDWCSDLNVSDIAWWKYDLGSGVTKQPSKFYLMSYCSTAVGGLSVKDFTIQGSSDNSNWNNVYSSSTLSGCADNSKPEQNWTFTNSTSSYRYWRIYMPNTERTDKHHIIYETAMYECLDCTSGTSTISTSQYSDQFNSYLSFLLDIMIIAGLSLIIIWLFR